MKRRVGLIIALAVLVLVAGAVFVLARGDRAKLAENATEGPSPTLPEPTKRLIPTVHIAPAKSWTGGAKPVAGPGLDVTAFATDLQHPRWLYVLPDGGVLVAESDGPPRPEDGKGVKGFVYKTVQKSAGSGTPSANRISLLRSANNTGVVTKTTFLEGLNSPFGMALVGGDFYVANTDAIMRFSYREGETRITEPGVKLTRSTRRSAQSPLDEKHNRKPRWHAALRDGGLQQQRRRKRLGAGGKPRGDPRGRSRQRKMARIRFGLA